ncbi:MAG TPA: glycosyltransferase [Acidimicrobiales bacterium]|nr:glycosyltransferase [Acidimicrobiales bacterium]
MRRLAVLSMHTSPLAQPGTGDGGGMNVYVRELTAALARSNVACDVFTRADSMGLPASVDVEPGFRVHHLRVGPLAPVEKGQLHLLTDAFTEAVNAKMDQLEKIDGLGFEAIHANYWLSGVVGHTLKHRRSLPLVSTFHTLDRVKAEASPEEIDEHDPNRRAFAEAEVIGCSDAVLASCSVEADQLVDLYEADRARVVIIPPGVDHAFFSPGVRTQAQRAVSLQGAGPLLLFVGRIQPLKGVDIAVHALSDLINRGIPTARLVVVGGPSGPLGEHEVDQLHRLVKRLGLSSSVHFVPPQPHEMLSTYYRAADCVLVPSMSESFGLVALEAASCGTPVVAAAVGGLTTLVDDGSTGYLIESRNPRNYADALHRLWTQSGQRALFSKNAVAKASSYTWPIAAEGLLSLYGYLTERSLVSC